MMGLRILCIGAALGTLVACASKYEGDDANTGDRDLDGFSGEEDCDDDDPLTYVGATELCDEKDNDCDGYIPANETNDWDGDGVGACFDCNDINADASEVTTWWADYDGDGYGDLEITKDACGPPPGYTDNSDDCDDDDPQSYPDQTWYLDMDEDGFGNPDIYVYSCLRPAGPWTYDRSDCDDLDPDAHPGAVWTPDFDGDGYGAEGETIEQCERPEGGPWSGNDDDCNDENPDIYPDQIWAPDMDGDGFGDMMLDEVSCGSPGGGYVWDATDCNDEEDGVYPGAEEVCDGFDSDCDGKELPEEIDADGDGFGVCQGDEDDTDPSVYPILYNFTGVLTNVPVVDLIGWEECFSTTYNTYESISSIDSACNKPKWLVACRQTGSTTLTTAAWAEVADVKYDTGTGNTLHNANGVDWYYNSSYSWGYTHESDSVSRNSCDTASGSYPSERLCWHTSGGSLSGGYRCGTTTGLNSSTAWERVVFHAD